MYFLGIVHNLNDTILNIGPIQIKYYNLLWIISFVLGWYLMKRIFQNEKKNIEDLDALFIYTVLATLLGARLGHVFFYDWGYYQDHLLEILLPIRESANDSLLGFINGYKFTGFTGLASHGATLGMLLGMYLFTKKHKGYSLMWILDRMVIPFSIGAFAVRLGNFFNSEINGKVVDGSFPLAVKFIRDSDDMHPARALDITKEKTVDLAYKALEHKPKFSAYLDQIPYRHPAQLYEAMAYLLVFALLYLLYWKTGKKDSPGFLFGLFFILLWTIRFFVEFVKKSQGGFEDSLGDVLTTGQWLSIPFILVGLFFIYRSWMRTA